MKEFLEPLYRVFLFFKNYIFERIRKITPRSSCVDVLLKDGVFVFPEPIDRRRLDILLREFETNIAGCQENQGQETGRVWKKGLISSVLEPIVQELRPHLDDFFGANAWKVELSYFQESSPNISLEAVPGGHFHVDDNKANVKYFMYLTDVGDKNGPFSCVKRTSRGRLENTFKRGLHWALFQERKSLYEFMLDVDWCKSNECEITGRKGTHFFVDTTSVHRAKPVLYGVRKVAVISFNKK